MTSKTIITRSDIHEPVLLSSTVTLLAPSFGETYLDLTAGYGGHAKSIIEKIGQPSLATLVDRDDNAIAALRLSGVAGSRIIKQDFASAAQKLVDGGEQFDMILLDLGVSSPQLDNAERGFSIQRSGPLDMRMDQSQVLTASDIVNTYSLKRLGRIISDYGEEPRAKVIAQAIVAARPLKTTEELASLIKHTIRGKWTKIHPATRTFQAIRIALNDELGQLEKTLLLLPRLLKPGGRVAIISFHSLEDRLVKRFLQEETQSGYEAELQLLTKKPISGDIHDVNNPRARSAKLRAAVKIKTQKKGHVLWQSK